MLFLLRNIRRNMLNNNKIATYFLYAIGEILLVVIGILIAVSIDDWNEERKQELTEKKYFQNLKNDLLADTDKLNIMIEYSYGKINASKVIMAWIKKDTIGSLYDFSNAIQTLIFVDDFRPDQSTYNEMKSSGNFSTIKNDELKLKILTLQQAYIEIGSMQEHVRNDFNVFLEDFEQYVDWSQYYDIEKSNNGDSVFAFDTLYIEQNEGKMRREISTLFENKVFANNVFLIEMNHEYWVEVFTDTKSQIGEIIAILDQEIKK
jgi:hypothetical protein